MRNTEKNTIKIVLVGCGRVAEKHLKAWKFLNKHAQKLQLPDLELIAVVDPNVERTTAFLRQHVPNQSIPCVPSLKELLAKQTPDLVAITTPSGTHFELAKLALTHRCHLLVEKPVTMFSEQAEELKRLAQENNCQIAIGHIYRYLPLMHTLASDISSGVLGKVLYGSIIVRWGHNQAYYDSASWRGTYELDGGAVMNQSIHALDLMSMLMQLSASNVTEISTMLGTLAHEMEAEDLGFVNYRFSDGKMLTLEASTASDKDYHEAHFYVRTDQAEIRAGLSPKKRYVSVIKSKENKSLPYKWRYIRQALKRYGLSFYKLIFNPHTAIYEDLLLAITRKQTPIADINSGINAVALVEKAYAKAGIERYN